MTLAPVVALHSLPAEVEARVREACLRAGGRPVASDAAAAESPALLVGHLPRRARRIPPDVLELAHKIDPSLPLLLACDEALVHPATTLRLAGVTLVEFAAEERLYSQIRIALTAARGSSRGAATTSLEEAGPHWWLGGTGPHVPCGVTRDEAVSVLVPLRGPLDTMGVLAAAHEIIGSPSPELSASLAACIGNDAGLLHVSREAQSWCLYWPAGVGGLWFYSSHRLPHLSELSRASDSPRILRSPAQPGEIVVATSRPLDASEQAVLRGLADGGPATLDRLRGLLAPIDAVVLEVR